MTHLRLKRAIIGGTAMLLVILLGGSAYLVDHRHEKSLLSAQAQIEHTSRVVVTVLNRQMLQVDSAVATIPSLLGVGGAAQPTPDAARKVLQGLTFQAFAFRDLLLLNEDGSIWASARAHPRSQPLPIDTASLGHLSPGAGKLIGPLRNRATGQWSLYVARRVQIPGAKLLAVAEVPIATLTTQLAPFGDMPGFSVVLTRADGTVMATLPHDELRIGQPSAAPRGEAGMARRRYGANGKVETIDVAGATLYPDLAVQLSLTAESALSDFARERHRLFVVLAFALSGVLLTFILLMAALRRHRRLDQEREQAQAMLEDAIASMADGFVMWDANDRLVKFNQHYRDLYARSAPFLVPGTSFTEIMRKGAEAGQYPQAGDDIEAFVQRMVEWHRAGAGVMERLLPDGRWLLITERRTANGGIVGIRTDITEFKRLLGELAAANARVSETMEELQNQNAVLLQRDSALLTQNMLFDAAVNNMSHGLMMVDNDERLIVGNRRLVELFQLDDAESLQGAPLETVFLEHGGRCHAIRAAGEELVQQLRRHIASQTQGSFVVTDSNGRALAVSASAMRSGGLVAIIEDVTERRKAEHQIVYLAHHDALTGLPNRVHFRSSLDEQMARLDDGSLEIALLYLDLDRFKQVNDTLGHSTGDRLLEQVAQRLRGSLRSTDVVARLGGDEFAISFVCDNAAMRAEMLGARIIARLAAPYRLDGCDISVGVSVGAAIAVDKGTDADTLLKNADMALYAAKNRGRGTYCVFEKEMATKLEARFVIETDLKNAIARSELEIAYQPLFGLKDNRVTSFEALLRWNHHERGRISPADFIPLAEETGAINQIGAWCLERACSDMASMPQDIMVAVNVSPVQLKSPNFVEIVTNALSRSGLAASRLELEITESALLDDDDRILAQLHTLNAMGVHIVLDDFGTGYSSLNYLRRFPFQKIKIDKVFINEATERADCSDIIRSIVELSERLGMATTAEGIETTEQLELVRSLGCDEAQGFLLGKPGSLLSAVSVVAGTLPQPGSAAKDAPVVKGSVIVMPPRRKRAARGRASRRAVQD